MSDVDWHLKHPVHGEEPWPVQAEATRRCGGRPKFGYWLEMGLGKTALTLNDYIGASDVDLALVVAPQSFKADWPAAPAEWGCGFLRTGMWPDDELPFDWDEGLYAINYEAVSRSGATQQLRKLLDQRRTMLIIDESKALGNPQSGWTKSVIELAKRAKYVRELNGTPITETPMDLYGQLRVLGQLNGVTPTQFRNRYAIRGGYMGRQILREFKNEEELGRILDACSFRALKKDWRKDLPDKSYSSIHLTMNNLQRRHYLTMLEEFYVAVEDKDEVTVNMVISQMMKLQQIVGGFIIVDGEPHVLVRPEENIKVKAAIDIASGPGKTILVHYYRYLGETLVEAAKKAGLNPAWIRGGMKPQDVVEMKRRFNDDPTCRVLVGEERATSRGHTLVGQPGNDRCNKTVFVENSFSYYFRSQMEDRNHRGVQDQMCTCYDFIAGPIDQTAVDALVSKKEMANALDDIIKSVHEERRRWRAAG